MESISPEIHHELTTFAGHLFLNQFPLCSSLFAQQHILNDIIKNQHDHPKEHVRNVILRKKRLLAEKPDTKY
ncbi:hypothetical protein BgiMline_026980 [Biomphalaria glabrata]